MLTKQTLPLLSIVVEAVTRKDYGSRVSNQLIPRVSLSRNERLGLGETKWKASLALTLV